MTSALDYPFGETLPQPAEKIEVVPGLFWLRMPLPFKLDHINLYLLEDDDGWTLVDTGVCWDKVKDLWRRGFTSILENRPIKRIIATHFHPDHVGLAGWLQETFDAPLWMTLGEWALGRMISLETSDSLLPGFRKFYRRAGFDDAMMDLVEERGNGYAPRVSPIPGTYRRIGEGETITIGKRTWRVIIGKGHSPEHAALYCDDEALLLSGDQILPNISPNVSIWPQEPDCDPLSLFLSSLERFRPLSAETIVMPSHGRVFKNLHARLDDLVHHHDERLEQTLVACASAKTGVELLKVLFTRELDSHQLFFAIGESLAHLHYLEARGKLTRVMDGEMVRFQQA